MDVLTSIFSGVGITDVFDVLATSVLFYYLILLIRGTRAVQILTGILVLVGLLGIARLLHLYLLGAILQLIVVGAAVTLPIVFQPELRRALEQLGRGGLFRLSESDLDDEERQRGDDPVIAIIARAAFVLARNRIGALIVLEQQSGLREIAETGTRMDARVSVELLLAIFMSRSPLHDGATIVRDGLIESAGCFLPLAEPRFGEERYGTRHRAALGITEQTDAVVIVVSEERGSVRIARDGKLSRAVDDEERLRRFLLAVTRPVRDPAAARADFVMQMRARIGAVRGIAKKRLKREEEDENPPTQLPA